MICKLCSAEFEQDRLGRHYCGMCLALYPDSKHRLRNLRALEARLNPVNVFTCKLCNKEFKHHWSGARYCAECKAAHPTCCRQLAEARTDAGRARNALWKRNWKRTPEGSQKSREQQLKYSLTPGAIANRVVYVQAHPEIYRRPNEFWSNREWMIFGLELPCAHCGETDKALLQVDHIIPRALDGSDDRTNLQVLCIDCHKQKTVTDLAAIRRYRGDNYEVIREAACPTM